MPASDDKTKTKIDDESSSDSDSMSSESHSSSSSSDEEEAKKKAKEDIDDIIGPDRLVPAPPDAHADTDDEAIISSWSRVKPKPTSDVSEETVGLAESQGD